MNKYIFRNVAVFIIMLFIISVATISVSSAVTYTNSKGTVTVKCGKYKKKFTAKKYGRNFSRALNEALETARKKSKASKIAKVTISKGNYTLDRTIKIYSNTTLVAKGCRIRYYGNLLRNGMPQPVIPVQRISQSMEEPGTRLYLIHRQEPQTGVSNILQCDSLIVKT